MSQISAEIYGTLEVSVEGASSTITVAIGTPGPAASVTVGTTTTLSPGASATVANVGSTAAAILNFGIPAGQVGATGPQGIQGPSGAAATIAAGTTTTGAAGSSASVTNSGTSSAAVFDFTIPRGDKGETGNTGATGATGPAGTAATISVGTVTTGLPGTSAIVTNVGTSSAAVFEITIPRGDKGDTGNTGATGATGAAGAGVASGGTTGQALVKASNTNYDTTWTTIQTGDKYLTTSTTSLTIGNGSKSLTVSTGLAYTTQQDIVIAYNSSNHMHAVVTSYDSGTGALVADVQNHTGSGTYAVWTVNVGGTTTAVLPIGGTTGQVLQKASNADFDVSWTTNSASVAWGAITGTLSSQTDLNTALGLKAPLASPSLTGTPLAPTAATATNTTQIATTAFVKAQSYLTTSTAASTYALIFSPTLTGTPLAPTASTATNSTQIATTAFVKNQSYLTTTTAASTYQTISGMSSYLTTATAATTYAPLASPTFTGTVTIPAGASISGYLTTASAASIYQTQSAMSAYLTTSSAASTYQTLSGMSSYLTTSAAASTYQPIGSYLTDAPSDGSQYARQNGAWAVVTGGGGGVAWGAITGTVTDQTDLTSYISGLGYQTASDVSTYVTGLGYLTDAPSDGFAYNRKDGAWEVAGSGGSVAWGAITGTVTDQTDLTTYISGLGYQTATDVSTYAYPLSSNPAGYLTSVPAPSVTNVDMNAGNYTLVLTDGGNTVNVNAGDGSNSGYVIYIPDNTSVAFPIGTQILFTCSMSSGSSYNYINGASGVTVIQTSNGLNAGSMRRAVKLDTDTWMISSQI